MLERPQLSLSIARRPSQLQVPGASSGTSSPLARSPVTPQTNSFFPPLLDSYFPTCADQGPSTPPISSSSTGLYSQVFPGRRGLLRRNSSLSSVSSSIGDDDDDLEREWTAQEEEMVRTTYDSCVAKHSLTEAPFPANGPPPSNFTNSVARQIIRAHQGPGRVTRSKTRTAALSASSDVEDNSEVEMDAPAPVKWRHGLRATRLKILSLVKERQNAHLEATPRQSDPEATPKRRKPMVRQGSMDFLPSMDNTSTIARLGSMLRQPANESFGPNVPTTAHSSRQFNRIRMQRTNSLSTIAGSPSQPTKERSPTKVSTGAPASSHRMMRLGSESNVAPTTTAAPMTRTLSANSGKGFEGFQRPNHHAPLPPPATTAPSLGLPQASNSYTSITPKKKPAPLNFGEGFSNLNTPHNLNNSKRPPPTSGLGSAFSSPIIGAYPTPDSLRKDGAKRKSWKKAKIDSNEENRMSIEGATEEEQPTFVNQAQAFALPSQPSADEALSFSIKRRARPSLSASSSLSNASASSSSVDAPTQPLPRVILTPSLSPSSSFSSLAHEPATPSPLSSTFDLNDLNLETLSREMSPAEEEVDEVESSEAERAQKTGLGFGFLDSAYVRAGNEARAIRDQYGDFAWAVEQRRDSN
ncbi:hypothetical protein JCM11491_007158 [Sporobolomyces phaffii]